MAIGINADSEHKDAAMTFLEWIASPAFAEVYVNKVPGFFSMLSEPIAYENALAQEFADLKVGAELTPRLALDRLSAGTPPLDDEIWVALQRMYSGAETPQQVTEGLQAGLDSWYTPAQ